jgi:hypothetical protein
MTNTFLSDLGEGLILRHSTAEDAEALAKFNKDIHGEDEWDARGIEEWTLDLISGESPAFGVGDFTIIENTHTGEIISCCCLISQTWSYEGMPFKVGRIELVGTRKDFRRRGLVREQMEILHQWSASRGELVQAITGIPYYYRQFGYEMTLNLDGGRSGFKVNVPTLKAGETEPYTFRIATQQDIPFLMAAYNRGRMRSLVHAVWNKQLWRYELTGKRPYNIDRREIYIIEDQKAQQVGFIGVPVIKWGNNSTLTVYELGPGFSWASVTPSVIRFLWNEGEKLAKAQNQPHEKFGFFLGASHPAYEVCASNLPQTHKPYAFYLRVPNLVDFLQEISPALENHLAKSAFDLFTGKVVLSFYRRGLVMEIKNGHIEEIRKIEGEALENATARFPDLSFLQLLFGYRSMAELDDAHADCYAKNPESQHLLDAIFPKKPSEVWPIS